MPDVCASCKAPMSDFAERFWMKVQIGGSGCWPWGGRTSKDGYGVIDTPGHDGPPRLAHRVAWEMVHGPLAEGECVLHSCDNPPCCNAFECLFVGTQAHNIADMDAKGRRARAGAPGERNANAKLTVDQVIAIRALCAAGITHGRVATQFGVTRANVQMIATRKAWVHLA